VFTKMSVGMRSRCSVRISTRVWACTPSTAETTSTAPSSTFSTRSTSAMKSGWPGVSIRLTVTSPMAKDTTADLMVMPRRRSRSRKSVWVLPSSTLPGSSMTPAAYSSRSVRVVLPASTCAKIPRFNICTVRHVLCVDGNCLPGGHGRLAHRRSLVDRSVPSRVQQTAARRATDLPAGRLVASRPMTTGGPERDDQERPLRRAPQLAVLLEGGDRKGLLHDMTAAILRHGGDIVLVEIIERGARSVVYWELDGVDDPEGLQRSFLEIDVVESLQRLPTMYQVWGKRIIVVGAGAQVGQVAIGAIGEADRHNIRGEKISVDTIPIVGETNLANAVRAVARLPRAVAVVLAGSLMGGEVTQAVDEVKARGILVVSLSMAGSVPDHADLVVTDPVQAGVMAVMAIASTASFDITRVRGHHF
jgi:energy-converting hydrogenase B subunit Q